MAVRYNTIDSIVAGDHFLVFDLSNGDYREVPLSVLTSYLNTNLSVGGTLTKQGASPSATGFSITVLASNTWLLITPVAGYAAGTIVLPTSPSDGDIVSVTCTQLVTALTVDGGTYGVVGAPSSLSANDVFRLRFDSTNAAWYVVA